MRCRRAPFLSILIGGWTLFSACERELQDMPETHPVRTVDVDLAVVFMYGSHEYELASEYTNAQEVNFKIDRFRFLLSDSYIQDDHGATIGTYPEEVLLVDAALGMNTFRLGSLTASHAHFIHWVLGLGPAANHQDPSLANPPLDDASMRCGPSAAEGFRFLELEGRWDSDGSGVIDGSDQSFAFHACGDAAARPASSRIHGDLPATGSLLVPVRVDMRELLEGIDLTNTTGVVTEGPMIDQLLSNLVVALATTH